MLGLSRILLRLSALKQVDRRVAKFKPACPKAQTRLVRSMCKSLRLLEIERVINERTSRDAGAMVAGAFHMHIDRKADRSLGAMRDRHLSGDSQRPNM